MSELSENYSCRVFHDGIMKKRLPREVYHSLKETMRRGQPLDAQIAEVVAGAMKDWAVEMGATHFTHWFQPMTGITAGKHDSFLSPTADGSAILEFSGKSLIQGEPDASSFPSGGLRATFEARGYTAWDPSSPAFIRDTTLYIPTAFCSYGGEALDQKTPLLRSMEVLSREAMRILRLLGNEHSSRVIATVGAEQEYFLIDREQYEKRLDLKLCGRTLMGARPPKGQELDDHYCGRIRLRVNAFMKKVDEELWQMGVPSKTKHNEVAPAQHELAPVFEAANVACDHNQLTMETLRIEAKRLGLTCLLHEKPFAGVSGSGKHNNWSLSTDDGINLLDPGKTPWENRQFLLFLSAVITAVDSYPELLRMTCATAGNDHRLGANERPPAIISVFLGQMLTDSLYHMVDPRKVSRQKLDTGVAILPDLPKDDSDRNRTSPFAFTGNKFEFRMLGAPDSIADCNSMLNTMVADVLRIFADRLSHADSIEEEIDQIIADTLEEHGRIIFNGNNYSDEWKEEAKKRGLPHIDNSVDAFAAICMPKNIELLSRNHVLSESECHARYEIMCEKYVKILHIEGMTMAEMVRRQILPAVIGYTGRISESLVHMHQAGFQSETVEEEVTQLLSLIDTLKNALSALQKNLAEASGIQEIASQAAFFRDVIRQDMDALRSVCDRCEMLVSEDAWPIPSYTDLLHRV